MPPRGGLFKRNFLIGQLNPFFASPLVLERTLAAILATLSPGVE
jgi:hypothetical protein